MKNYSLEEIFNEAQYPEITFVPPKEYPFIKSAFRAKGKHITICGPSGSGKSTLVERLIREFQIEVSEVLNFNARNYSEIDSFLEIIGQILKVEPLFPSVTQILKDLKFVLVDDIHHLSNKARMELAHYLKLWHENGVRFIIIGIASSAAISGEKTLPVLEAAHIKPYSQEGPHNTSNGLLLRKDIHTLFDRGYITVGEDLQIEVSKRIKEDYGNGREYYAFHGKKLVDVPDRVEERPSKQFIQWHNQNVFIA